MRTSILLTLVLIVFALANAPAYGQRAEASINVTAAEEAPKAYRLTAPHPNPFNPQTQFTLSVTETQQVTVEVYNMLGRRVAVLHKGRLAADQTHTFTFEASNAPSGIYLIRITGEQFSATQRVTLLK